MGDAVGLFYRGVVLAEQKFSKGCIEAGISLQCCRGRHLFDKSFNHREQARFSLPSLLACLVRKYRFSSRHETIHKSKRRSEIAQRRTFPHLRHSRQIYDFGVFLGATRPFYEHLGVHASATLADGDETFDGSSDLIHLIAETAGVQYGAVKTVALLLTHLRLNLSVAATVISLVLFERYWVELA